MTYPSKILTKTDLELTSLDKFIEETYPIRQLEHRKFPSEAKTKSSIEMWGQIGEYMENHHFDRTVALDAVVFDICARLETGATDIETAHELGIPPTLVNDVRIKKIGTIISDDYDYPILFTDDLVEERIRYCVIDLGLDNPSTANWLGVPEGRVERVVNASGIESI